MIVSLSESGKIFNPGSIGRVVRNMASDPDGVISTAGHISLYDQKATGLPTSGVFHGLGYNASLNGARELLLCRMGGQIYVHQGWNAVWDGLLDDNVTDDVTQPYNDMFLSLSNGNMLWCNGIDTPIVVDANGRSYHQLGFNQKPMSPVGIGPTVGRQYKVATTGPTVSSSQVQPSNHYGYAVQGKIGTISSDGLGEDGSLLAGSYTYYVQLEDMYGNKSPLSSASAAVILDQSSAGYVNSYTSGYTRVNSLDGLCRQFAVCLNGPHPEHTKAIWLYRTPNTRMVADQRPRLLARLETLSGYYFDNTSDAELLNENPAIEYVEVMPFKVGCISDARLICGNFRGGPNTIRWSEQNFHGSWRDTARVDLPEPVTCIKEHMGTVLAFTAKSLYQLTVQDNEGVAQYIGAFGCAGPGAACTADDGSIVWLGSTRGNCYKRDASFNITDLSADISQDLRIVNPLQLSRCVAAFDTNRKQIIFPLGGLSFAYNLGIGWSRYMKPQQINAMVAGPSDVILCVAVNEGDTGVYVFDRYTPVADLINPEAYFESVEITLDPFASEQLVLSGVKIHYIESDAGDGRLTDTGGWASVTIYKGRRGEFQDSVQLQPVQSGSYGRIIDPNFRKNAAGNPLGIKYSVLGDTVDKYKVNWMSPSTVTLRYDVGAMSTISRFYISVQALSPLRLVGVSFDIVQSKNKNMNKMPIL